MIRDRIQAIQSIIKAARQIPGQIKSEQLRQVVSLKSKIEVSRSATALSNMGL